MRGLTPAELERLQQLAGPVRSKVKHSAPEYQVLLEMSEQGRAVRSLCGCGEECGSSGYRWYITAEGREALRLWPEVRRFFGPDRSALPEAKS